MQFCEQSDCETSSIMRQGCEPLKLYVNKFSIFSLRENHQPFFIERWKLRCEIFLVEYLFERIFWVNETAFWKVVLAHLHLYVRLEHIFQLFNLLKTRWVFTLYIYGNWELLETRSHLKII